MDWRLGLFVNLLAVRFILSALPQSVADPALLGLSLIVLIWQVVGGLRIADKTLRASGTMYAALVLYAGILVVLVLALLQAIDLLASRFAVPQPAYSLQIELLETRDNGREVLVTGGISLDMNTRLKATLKATPTARVLVLNSEGGNIFAGRAMAITITNAQLATRVDHLCYSACTIAFIAGTSHRLGKDAELGFHGYAFDTAHRVQTLDVAEQEARDRAFFSNQGVSDAFLEKAFATPPSTIWLPTRAELAAAGVIPD